MSIKLFFREFFDKDNVYGDKHEALDRDISFHLQAMDNKSLLVPV